MKTRPRTPGRPCQAWLGTAATRRSATTRSETNADFLTLPHPLLDGPGITRIHHIPEPSAVQRHSSLTTAAPSARTGASSCWRAHARPRRRQDQFETLRGQLRAAQEQLAGKLYAPGPVKAEDLTSLIQQIGQLRGQLTQEGLQVALEVRGVLTPEQLAKAAQTRQRMNELRAEMRSLLGQ